MSLIHTTALQSRGWNKIASRLKSSSATNFVSGEAVLTVPYIRTLSASVEITVKQSNSHNRNVVLKFSIIAYMIYMHYYTMRTKMLKSC